jgi:hypothetical protein
MSPSFSDLGDAVRPDGTLKDASEILWQYNEDESLPSPSDSASMLPPSSGSHSPATIVADVCRSSCVFCPSQQALEAAETSSSAPASTGTCLGKRKAQADDIKPEHRATKVIVALDDSDDDSKDAPPTEPNTEPEDDYESIKAMADTDNEVRCSHPHFPWNGLTFMSLAGCNLQTPSRAHRRCAAYFLS